MISRTRTASATGYDDAGKSKRCGGCCTLKKSESMGVEDAGHEGVVGAKHKTNTVKYRCQVSACCGDVRAVRVSHARRCSMIMGRRQHKNSGSTPHTWFESHGR